MYVCIMHVEYVLLKESEARYNADTFPTCKKRVPTQTTCVCLVLGECAPRVECTCSACRVRVLHMSGACAPHVGYMCSACRVHVLRVLGVCVPLVRCVCLNSHTL